MKSFKLTPQLKQQLRAALKEDIGRGDKTTELLIPKHARGKAHIVAKDAGVFCGGFLADHLFRQLDSKIKVKVLKREGALVRKREPLIQLEGKLSAIVIGERTVLNFIGHLMGIATQTNQYVQKLNNKKIKVLDTRKTTPLWRALEKYAVSAGGGTNHRMGLYDAVFVKENHRRYGNLEKLKKIPRKFEIEVRNQRELTEALALKPKVILLDNFTPEQVKAAVKKVRQSDKRVCLEVSGGITLKNIRKYANTGIKQISIGALTHSVPCFDLSLLVKD